jgi:hypothetical protein
MLWPREELYQGKPFSYWVDRLPWRITTTNGGVMYWLIYSTPMLSHADPTTFHQEADKACRIVSSVGAKHLPMLVRRLQSRDFPWEMAALNWAVKRHLIKAAWVRSADVRRGQALTAIISLGDEAKPIFPDLRALAKDKDPQVQAAAKYALERVRPRGIRTVETMQSARKASVK